MIGVNSVKPGRRALKIEKPKPLRLAPGGEMSLEAVVGEIEEAVGGLGGAGGLADPRVMAPVVAGLCANLKLYGGQLETAYKDQLDKCFAWVRTNCRDDRLPLSARYRLLEIIELRAAGWKAKPNVAAYYQAKLESCEADEASIVEEVFHPLHASPAPPHPAPHHPAPLHPAYAAQQQAAAALAAATHQLQYGGYGMLASLYAPPPYTPPLDPAYAPAPPAPAPAPVLSPGEVVRTSGKFTKPQRIAGKNYCKDEVVIRNQDSGKVMGIKGRRVHLIEELSETIISFQRVSPGARERLVQITGPTDENISQAKHLIEETIRRNASPVRDGGSSGGSVFSCSLGGSHDSIHHDSDDDGATSGKRSSVTYPPSDPDVQDYRYTVTHGSSALRITGASLSMVKTAKLLLDEWFNGDRNLAGVARSLEGGSPPLLIKPATPPATPPLSTGSPTPSGEEPLRGGEESLKNGGVTVIRQPLLPCSSKEAPEGSSNGANTRRQAFARTSESRRLNGGQRSSSE